MVRLVGLLCVAMFVALLIGGEDRGQMRQGLSQPPLMPPVGTRTPVAAAPVETAVADLVPVAAPAPARPAKPAAIAAIVPEAAPLAPAAPVFTLSNIEEADAAAPAPEPSRVLYVAATSINVRKGPSTNDQVLGRLTRNEAVSLVRDAGDGWLQVRIEGDGIEGFVAARLMTDRAPAP
jgi:hypothetical protein